MLYDLSSFLALPVSLAVYKNHRHSEVLGKGKDREASCIVATEGTLIERGHRVVFSCRRSRFYGNKLTREI